MGIEDVIAKERQRYVAFYSDAMDRLRADGTEVAGELLIVVNDDVPLPYRYLRVDAATRSEGEEPQFSEIRLERDPGFEATSYNFGSFQVDVYPFTWSAVQIAFNAAPKSVTQIEGWITRWLDTADQWVDNEQRLSGAVHSFTQIQTDGQWWFLAADFGTAPADALIEFIELLVSQGMTRIVLQGA